MLIEDVLRAQGACTVDIAASQSEAVDAALAHRPDLITSDVCLADGRGPIAVRTIHDKLGPIPVIFITGTPEECDPCDPEDIILSKPLDHVAIATAFRHFTRQPQ
ncbi:hypothetical protein WP12_01395 [Sphingomonas sp. SRS2]|nr:hypothetical protein WP12_01395 [Sphingomonas sp. SRS2]